MDKHSRRERMREWIALGVRDGLQFKELARRAGVTERTLRRWNAVFRDESAQRATAGRDERAFVELIERSDPDSSRIEIVLPGERRRVIEGHAVVEALARILLAVERC